MSIRQVNTINCIRIGCYVEEVVFLVNDHQLNETQQQTQIEQPFELHLLVGITDRLGIGSRGRRLTRSTSAFGSICYEGYHVDAEWLGQDCQIILK
jgi:hypothetical protein